MGFMAATLEWLLVIFIHLMRLQLETLFLVEELSFIQRATLSLQNLKGN